MHDRGPVDAITHRIGKVIQRYPSHSYAHTSLVRKPNGEYVIVKAATGQSGCLQIACECRHLTWLSARSKYFSQPITCSHENDAVFMVLPFHPAGTLADHIERRRITRTSAIKTGLRVFSQLYISNNASASADAQLQALVFQSAYIDRVRGRLMQLEKRYDEFDILKITENTLIINDEETPRPLRILDSLCASRKWVDFQGEIGLGYTAWHGDLTPMNIICAPSPDNQEFEFALIDPRGDVLWKHDHPFWDPAYDAGKLCFYFDVWQPAQSGCLLARPNGSSRRTFNLHPGQAGTLNAAEMICSELASHEALRDSTLFQLRVRFASACHSLSDALSRLAKGNHTASITEYLVGARQLMSIQAELRGE